MQQAGSEGQVNIGARRSSRQLLPQQKVPVIQQSVLHGLPVTSPDSSWRPGDGSAGSPVSTEKPRLSELLPRNSPSVTTGSASVTSMGVLIGGNRSRLAQMLERFVQHPFGTGMQESYSRAPSASQNVPQQNCPAGQQSGLQVRLLSPITIHGCVANAAK